MKIRELRRASGMTQTMLAERLGCKSVNCLRMGNWHEHANAGTVTQTSGFIWLHD